MPAASTTPFDSLTKLPSDLMPTGMQVNKFSGYYVHLNTNPRYFDWDGFAYAVNRYSGKDLVGVPIDYQKGASIDTEHEVVVPGSDFDVVKIKNGAPLDDDAAIHGHVGEMALAQMLDWMVHELHDKFGVAVNVTELTANIYATFTNLQWAHSNGFADFSGSSTGTNSSWEYRTVYAYPKPGDPSKFLSLVTTIVLAANIQKETSWWGLVSSTRARFYGEIIAGKLLVTKGFRSPV
ncbi:delta-endotoxin CytB [Heliocybe sulcata]|uniref:Delta-endotoxin CytB n=1 Tax=Heliocybe sulcata TaxID=5364 RepID=A0A5C3MZG4_9AGAM|nr:delta-endotoxin CytB [Heliocybe sulcata]